MICRRSQDLYQDEQVLNENKPQKYFKRLSSAAVRNQATDIRAIQMSLLNNELVPEKMYTYSSQIMFPNSH